jgi:hypothetical protein
MNYLNATIEISRSVKPFSNFYNLTVTKIIGLSISILNILLITPALISIIWYKIVF